MFLGGIQLRIPTTLSKRRGRGQGALGVDFLCMRAGLIGPTAQREGRSGGLSECSWGGVREKGLVVFAGLGWAGGVTDYKVGAAERTCVREWAPRGV